MYCIIKKNLYFIRYGYQKQYPKHLYLKYVSTKRIFMNLKVIYIAEKTENPWLQMAKPLIGLQELNA